jgi:hypothetical protein
VLKTEHRKNKSKKIPLLQIAGSGNWPTLYDGDFYLTAPHVTAATFILHKGGFKPAAEYVTAATETKQLLHMSVLFIGPAVQVFQLAASYLKASACSSLL